MTGWPQIFAFVITPILFGGLFSMSFITMIIALRGEKRAIASNQRDIVKNARLIARNYKLLKEAAQGHAHLEEVLNSVEAEKAENGNND